MAPVSVLSPRPGECVLDLCAAPGGKSTQIAAALAGEGLLVSNEPVPSRAKILSRNIERMGVPNALVVSAQPEALAARWGVLFDAVLVDAPCSGEGMFRRHPKPAPNGTPPLPRAVPSGSGVSWAVRPLCCAPADGWCTAPAHPLPRGKRRNHALVSSGASRLFGAALFPAGQLWHIGRSGGHAVPVSPPRARRRTFRGLPAPRRRRARVGPDEACGGAALAARARRARRLFGLCCASSRAMPAANAQLGDALLCAPDLPPLDGVRVLRAGVQLGTLKGKVFAPDHALAMCLSPACGLPVLALDRAGALRIRAGRPFLRRRT